ncbi:MAG: ribosome biogenesis GTP-binding protein YihA/YsxC [Chitinispirillaceae bacterium]|jgi:GTP-binding protein|nr:ribosome biogenesis GTP-binding protein YihA/YsxC [Chitinispirillaceae bacterium]
MGEKPVVYKVRFLLSAGKHAELPAPQGAEFALLGRSNVGKSSFINHVFADRSLARTAKAPGTTGCANFYRVDDGLCWVDLPGYGYARTRRDEKERWSLLIREYCERRENLCGIIWIIDIRHIGLDMDCEAAVWFHKLGRPVLPVLSKADKLSRNEQRKQIATFKKCFGEFGDPVVHSINDSAGRERFLDRFRHWQESMRTGA